MRKSKKFIALLMVLSFLSTTSTYADEADDMLNELFGGSVTNETSTQTSGDSIQTGDTQINNNGSVQSGEASITSESTSLGEDIQITENSTTAGNVTVNQGAENELIPLNSAGETPLSTETGINNSGVDANANAGVTMNGVTVTKMPQTGPEQFVLILLSAILGGMLFIRRKKSS